MIDGAYLTYPCFKVKSISKVERLLFYFVVLDIFFLPYFTYFSISFSVPLITFWALLNFKKITKGPEGIAFVFLILLMLISTFFSQINFGQLKFETDFSTSIKRAIQYSIAFCYYFFFKEYFSKETISIKHLVVIFMAYLLVFALLFYFFPNQYALLKTKINPADSHTKRYLEGDILYRFNYLWTDPNNIAYLSSGLMSFYLIRTDSSRLSKVFVVLSSLLVVALTASIGGIISYLAVILFSFWFKNYSMKRVAVTFFKRLCLIAIGLAFLFLILKLFGLSSFVETLVESVTTRFSKYGGTTNGLGGRVDDLIFGLSLFNPLFLFVGSGQEGFSAEIGHIYFVYMFGLVAYIFFMYLTFRKGKRQRWCDYVWVFPFFVAFTINIAIGEFKWFAIYLLLIAYARYSRAIEGSKNGVVKSHI